MEIDIKSMTIEEKMRAMEVLWDDFRRNAPDFPSPQWHEKILQERERALQEGRDAFVSWETAKKDLWNEVS